MKQLIDFTPLVVFFLLFRMYDIYVATAALIIATAMQLIFVYLFYKKIEKMQLITFIMVLFFGGMTLFLQDDNFIKWKVTIVYFCFSLGLIISHLMGKSAIKGLLNNEISLPNHIWSHINWAWVAFFFFCSLLNLYIAYHFPLEFWVNFKVFGLLAITLLFTILTGIYIYKYLPKEKV